MADEWKERGLVSRRAALKTGLVSLASWALARRAAAAVPVAIALPAGLQGERWDFETKGVGGWTVVNGRWTVETMPTATSRTRVLVQRAVKNAYNLIVAPSGPYSDIDVSMQFRPISGREDASGGIVFRFDDGKYYVLRANALENNFRLYCYDRGRHMLEGTSVKAPALGQWHTVRAVVVGDHIQGWLDGHLLLDHHDTRFRAGRIGLWTKADSITAFDDVTIRGVSARV